MKEKFAKRFIFWIIMISTVLGSVDLQGQGDYYLTDTTSHYGVKLNDNGDLVNSKLCQLKMKNKVIDFSPQEVSEYGFKDGRVYVARDIKVSDSSERVFLKRLSKGKAILYSYKTHGYRSFFVEKENSQLIEIPGIRNGLGYKEQLGELTSDCKDVQDARRYLSYRENVLASFFKRYNKCELRPFPHIRYGAFIGAELDKLVKTSDNSGDVIEDFSLKYDPGSTIGVFFDIPVMVSDISLHTDIIYSRHGYSYNAVDEGRNLDFVANITSLKFPVLVRYTFPKDGFRPFVNAGVLICLNTRAESTVYEAIVHGNVIEINDVVNSSSINEQQYGFSVGGGVEKKIREGYSFFSELRFSKLYGKYNSLGNSAISLNAGILF